MDENRQFRGPQGAARPDGPPEATNKTEAHPAPKTRWRRWVFGGIALAAAVCLATWGIIERNDMIDSLAKTAGDASLPKVTLVSPTHGPPSRKLTLPGDTQAWFEAPIFAQVTGYVKMWYKDYGAIVQKGDLLAAISTPDLDQQLQQARAQLDVAKAKYKLANLTAQRWKKLAGTQAVSQETVDVNVADAAAQQSMVQAAQFNVARYEAQEAFKQVVAPFDGVVTARDTNVGNFVNASGGSADKQGRSELFTVSDIHAIRIFVAVPQNFATLIVPGMVASMMLPQYPDRLVPATVLTVAKAFNPEARTVVTELTVPNPNQEIWPGGFAEVTFTVPTDPNILIIPEQSMLFRSAGLQVALVGRDNKVHLQDIEIGLNLGDTVQVTKGLKAGDRLIASPSDGLVDGEMVDVVNAPSRNADIGTSTGSASQSSSGK